jgi:hypothetical protein
MNRDVENILHRLSLRLAGAKKERIRRVIDHFASRSLKFLDAGEEPSHDRSEPSRLPEPEVLALQEMFRQKASSPQAELQPWLENLLDARGLVRCYATDDANPTKQLKNKLSQAAAAIGGMLLLMLADEDAFHKANEALLDRWATNDEWPKSVACVALAYPVGAPDVRAIVEWRHSPWPGRIRQHLFPSADVMPARGGESDNAVRSSAQDYAEDTGSSGGASVCGHAVPLGARFCPQCGTPLTK